MRLYRSEVVVFLGCVTLSVTAGFASPKLDYAWSQALPRLVSQLEKEGIRPDLYSHLLKPEIQFQLPAVQKKLSSRFERRCGLRDPLRPDQKEVAQADEGTSSVDWSILGEDSVRRTLAFIKAHETAFMVAEALYGVPITVVASVLRIETNLGGFLGRFPVIATLASLASLRFTSVQQALLPELDPKLRRCLGWSSNQWSSYMVDTAVSFDEDLRAFFRLSENRLSWAGPFDGDLCKIMGSYAGCFGYSQFRAAILEKWLEDNQDEFHPFDWTDSILYTAKHLASAGWARRGGGTLLSYNRAGLYRDRIMELHRSLLKKDPEYFTHLYDPKSLEPIRQPFASRGETPLPEVWRVRPIDIVRTRFEQDER
jgi:membrane-bound lytic murein transglycosylase B